MIKRLSINDYDDMEKTFYLACDKILEKLKDYFKVKSVSERVLQEIASWVTHKMEECTNLYVIVEDTFRALTISYKCNDPDLHILIVIDDVLYYHTDDEVRNYFLTRSNRFQTLKMSWVNSKE